METKQPLFDSESIAKDLIESNDHVDWTGLYIAGLDQIQEDMRSNLSQGDPEAD